MGEALRRNGAVAVEDLAALPSSILRSAGLAAAYRSVLIVPLIGAGRPIGALAFLRESSCEFAQDTLEIARAFANQSATAITAPSSRTKSMRAVAIWTRPCSSKPPPPTSSK